MKKVLISLVCFLSTIISFAQAQTNDALYIYRNDGKFNAFFFSEIDSITTSNLDEFGNKHDEFRSQIVWTQDSVYWIPLEVIDSVSLCKPENKLASGVRKIDDILPYITEVNGMILNVLSTIPTNLIPKKGEVLIYEKFDDERFPSGFAGRVNDTDNLKIICDSISFEDVYDKYVCFGEYVAIEEQDDSGNSRLRLAPKRVEGKISPSISIRETIGSQSSGLSATLDGRIAFDVRIVCKLEPSEPAYFDLSISPNIKATVGIGVKGKFNPVDWLAKKVTLAGIPIPNTLFFLKVKGGPVIKPSVEASISASTETEVGFKTGIKYEQGQFEKYCHNTSKWFAAPTISGSISGRVFAGIQLEFGVFSVGEILSASIEKELGPELVANLTENMFNSNKYEELQKAKIDLNFQASIGGKAGFKFSAWGINGNITGRFTLASISTNISSWKLVPSFSAPQINMTNLTKATISVIPGDKLLPPGVEIGLGVWDEHGTLVDAQYSQDKFRVINEWPLEKYQTTFEGLTPGSEYVSYPMVKFWGMELKASPSTSFVTNTPVPARITDFKVNSATFVRDGFDYKGKNYYYNYAATTTVELENNEGVDDWGYVYKDVDGDTVHISVKAIGGTDSRYNYYRTIPKSTATLYGYAKYEDKYVYDEPKDYPLEYTFHPTAYVGDEIADSLTCTSAQFEYGFDDVPRTGKCFTAVQSARDNEPIVQEVSYAEKDTVMFADLFPGTTYEYWAYAEYAGMTYTSDKKSLTTLTPTAHVEKANEDKVTMTSAEIGYGFANVPENAKCYVGISAKVQTIAGDGVEINKSYSQTFPVENTTGATYEFNGLYPSTTYTYYAYVEYEGGTWYSDGEKFTTKAPPTPVATTGDCSNVTTNTAKVSCSFENVPEGGVCGVEYTWSNGSKKQSIGNVNGTQTITLSGLESGTAYSYCAYVEAYGQTYYGGEKTFTTQVELPNLAGTWSCTVYKDDGSVLDTPTLTLTSDGKATIKNSSFTSEDKVGGWSINANGKASISFNWASSGYNPVYYQEAYSGTVNSMTNPSSIEGTVSRMWAGLSEHGNSYKFKMTR